MPEFQNCFGVRFHSQWCHRVPSRSLKVEESPPGSVPFGVSYLQAPWASWSRTPWCVELQLQRDLRQGESCYCTNPPSINTKDQCNGRSILKVGWNNIFSFFPKPWEQPWIHPDVLNQIHFLQANFLLPVSTFPSNGLFCDKKKINKDCCTSDLTSQGWLSVAELSWAGF